MESPRYRRIVRIMERVRDADAGERPAVLAAACGDDDDLRAEIEILLTHDRHAANFLEPPVRPPAPPGVEMPRPERIGRYRVIGELGSGAMGVVYCAEQDQPRRLVALKVLHPFVTTPERRLRFELEADVLGRLEHPGIAQIYEAGTSGGPPNTGPNTGPTSGQATGPRPFIAMELVEGQPLTAFLAQDPLDLDAKLDLLARICDAIEYAHQRGVIHRDLKPRNILVERTGTPRVLDFGIARLVASDDLRTSPLTRTGDLLGTVPYMSPEQLNAPTSLDTRSDVYALGVLLYEMLSGRLPYELPEGLLEQVHAIVHDEPAPLGPDDRRLRGDVDTIVRKALAKEPNRRYQSAGAMAADIRRYLDDEPIEARPPTTMYQLRKFARRNRSLVTAAASTFAILAGSVIALSIVLVRETHSNRQAVAASELGLHALRAIPDGPDRQEHISAINARIGEVADRETRATLREAFANGLEAVGKHAAAQTQFEGARLEIEGLNVPEQQRLRLMHSIGQSVRYQGRPADAIARFESVLIRQVDVLGPDHQDTLMTKNSLAVVLLDVGRSAEARPHIEDVVARHRDRSDWKRDPAALSALNTKAAILLDLEQFEEAAALFEETLTLRDDLLGSTHVDTMTTAANLAALQARLGRFDEAGRQFRRIVRQRETDLGPGHEDTLIAMNNLAYVLNRGADPEAALELTSRLVARARGSFDPTHWYHGVFATQHAHALLRSDQVEEARRTLEAGLALLRARLDARHSTIRRAEALFELFPAEAGSPGPP